MKTKIKRSELEEVYSIACDGWKKTLLGYAGRNPFGETIEFSANEIEEMIKASTADQLRTVKRIFDVRDTWEDIKTLEDAIKKLGEKDEEVIQLNLLRALKISDRILAQQEATCFVRALNNRFEFDWNDSNQKKWRIWWWMDTFRFDGSHYGGSDTGIPASLCFKNKELSDYAGNNENYKNICKRFMY